MRTATDIKIQRAILHRVNPRVAGGFMLSEACLPITAKHPVALFLANHIQNGLQDQALRAARFLDGDADCTDDYRRIIDGKKNFVDASRELATALYEVMSKDKRISPGALALCFYKAGNQTQISRYLAVLKLDQGDAFKTTTGKDRKGRTYVTLDELQDVMPRTGERLQKCAFVRPLVPRPDDYDLMVLDRQHGADEPARFFTTTFLKAALAADPATLTKEFHHAAFAGLNSVRDQIGQTEYERIRTAIDGAVHAEAIDIDDWAAKLRAPAVARKAVLGSVRKMIPDATIETDAQMADRLTAKRLIRGQHGLKLVFDSAHEADILRSCKEKHDVNRGSYRELVLHVRDFREER